MWLGVGLRQFQGRDKGVLRQLAKVYHPYLAGVFAALAYVLILIAMNFVSNVSFVQAFRQLSLPLSALLGYLILKEKVTPLRWLGLLLIMGGLVLSLL
jgi:drug/metabolite transporter (DMT)-like permease